MTAKAQQATRFTDSPTAWFVTLEIARQRGDFEQAAHALRELRRLGVHVRFARATERAAREGLSAGAAPEGRP